jgi:hypothetical protein
MEGFIKPGDRNRPKGLNPVADDVAGSVHIDGLRLYLNCGHQRSWRDDGTILTEEKIMTRRKTYPSANLPTTNPTWTDPGIRTKRPATNRLSHGTA